jgi:Mrp family chromosome partitioning ATPase/capsular polysaccharide biosynthesis protein
VNSEIAEKRDVRDYIRPVLKRWWLILAVVPLVTAGTYLYYNNKPKTYGAATELFFQPSSVSAFLGSGENNFATEATVENLALLIQTHVVGGQAEKILANKHVKREGTVTAERVENSNFIVISATASTPRGAALLANAYAAAFIQTQQQRLHGEAAKALAAAEKQLAALPASTEDLGRRSSLEEQVQTLRLINSQSGSSGFRVVERAFPSPTPLNHNPVARAIFALVLSLMLTIAAAFGLEYLTRRITSIEVVEEIYERPVLTEVPKVDMPAPFEHGGISMEKQLHEPFHRLQMNLDMLAHERPLRTILIASAAPGEGKSIVTRNLGLAYREAGRNVAVLDADFRRATLGGLLGAQEGPGLTDILSGRASFGQAVQEVAVPVNGNGASGGLLRAPGEVATSVQQSAQGDLAVVPAGAHQSNLAAVLSSGGLRQTLKTASDLYDTVIIDSSPLLATADVLPLLSGVDGVLIVARMGVTTRDSALRLMRELRRIPNINIIGVVVNGIPPRTYRARAYGYYYG